MDTLFLCHRIPFPPDKGDKIRAYQRLVQLCSAGAVDLVCHVDDPRDLRHVQILEDMCRSVVALPLNPWASRLRGGASLLTRTPLTVAWMTRGAAKFQVERLLAQHDYDLIYGYSSQIAVYLPEQLQTPWVMDLVDVDSSKFAGYADTAGGLKRWIFAREAKRLAALEGVIGDRADAVVLATEREAELYKEQIGRGRAVPITNGVRLPDAVPPAAERDPSLMVFVGAMDYPPNVEAARYGAEEVLPLVRQQHPDARFRIVGRNPTPAVQRLAELPGVEVTGGVAELRPHLEAAGLALVPLLIARGIQNKVLEALAHALPVVATPAVMRCMSDAVAAALEPCEDPAAMAQACSALIADPERRQTRGDAGRDFVRTHHNWDHIAAQFDGLLSELGVKRSRDRGVSARA